MRRIARPHPESDRHVLCPFCETSIELARSIVCAGCGARGQRDGDRVVFDDASAADRQEVTEGVREGRGTHGTSRPRSRLRKKLR
ncbi:MAG: hypothetical protein AAF560_12960 [Acidobacteriota bacterium]